MISKEFKLYLENLDINVYCGFLPQGTALPAVIYMPTSIEYGDVLEGSDGTVTTTFRTEVLANELTEAEELADSLRLNLINFTGAWNDINILNIRATSATVDILEFVDVDDFIYQVVSEFIIQHTCEKSL